MVRAQSTSFCRKLCLCHYPGLRSSALQQRATSARAYGTTRTSLCSLSLSSAVTLAGAVLRECNAPTAASSARANDTTTCSDVQTAHRNGESHFRSLGRSAQQFATSRSHGRSAPASRCRLRPGTPQAKRRTRSRRHRSSRTKERAEAAFTSRPAAGWSDDLAFQQQTAVSSDSPLGRHCAGFCYTTLLHSCRRHCNRVQISFDNLG